MTTGMITDSVEKNFAFGFGKLSYNFVATKDAVPTNSTMLSMGREATNERNISGAPEYF